MLIAKSLPVVFLSNLSQFICPMSTKWEHPYEKCLLWATISSWKTALQNELCNYVILLVKNVFCKVFIILNCRSCVLFRQRKFTTPNDCKRDLYY